MLRCFCHTFLRAATVLLAMMPYAAMDTPLIFRRCRRFFGAAAFMSFRRLRFRLDCRLPAFDAMPRCYTATPDASCRLLYFLHADTRRCLPRQLSPRHANVTLKCRHALMLCLF